MKKVNFVDIFEIILSIASIAVGLIYAEYRVLAWVGTCVLIVIAGLIKSYQEISELKTELQKTKEKLNIYKELIDIKSDINLLKSVHKK